MVKYISSIPRDEIKAMVVEGETMISGTYDNFLLTTQIPEGGKWGGLSLTKLMVDANESRKHKTKPLYKINETPKTKSSALYLIRCRNANKSHFKIGRASKLVARLSKYKTALPYDNEILIIAVLVIPEPSVIVALEKTLIANLRQFCEEFPTKISPLRLTEWFRRGSGHFGEALVLRTLFCLASFAAKKYDTINIHMYLFGKAAFNEMMKLKNIGYTPRWDVVNKKWKGLSPIEAQLADAEAALVKDDDDEGFTKKQLASVIDEKTQSVVVLIQPISPSLLSA